MKSIVVRGVVVEGRRLGRELGFPTANIRVEESFEAEDGVYRSEVRIAGESYLAMSNLGHNPSVGGCARRLETHLFNYEGSLYGEQIEVVLLEKIRDEIHFDSIAALREQIARDKARILGI